jgi:hypothetical protein
VVVLVVLLIVAAFVLVGVVVVAIGRGGEMTRFPSDVRPLDADIETAADVVLLRPPGSLWGYDKRATDDALNMVARTVTERDVEIATLRRQLADIQSASDEPASDQPAAPDRARKARQAWEPDPSRAAGQTTAAGHARQPDEYWAQTGRRPDQPREPDQSRQPDQSRRPDQGREPDQGRLPGPARSPSQLWSPGPWPLDQAADTGRPAGPAHAREPGRGRESGRVREPGHAEPGRSADTGRPAEPGRVREPGRAREPGREPGRAREPRHVRDPAGAVPPPPPPALPFRRGQGGPTRPPDDTARPLPETESWSAWERPAGAPLPDHGEQGEESGE